MNSTSYFKEKIQGILLLELFRIIIFPRQEIIQQLSEAGNFQWPKKESSFSKNLLGIDVPLKQRHSGWWPVFASSFSLTYVWKEYQQNRVLLDAGFNMHISFFFSGVSFHFSGKTYWFAGMHLDGHIILLERHCAVLELKQGWCESELLQCKRTFSAGFFYST